MIIIDISLVSFDPTFIPFALYKSLLKFEFEPSLNVFILKVPLLIINFVFAWKPSLYEFILKIPSFIVRLPSLSVSP